MAVSEKIHEALQKLPVSLQMEVLDYVEYLLLKWELEAAGESSLAESRLSLALAMQGMEDEESPVYSMGDLEVVF